MSSVGQAARRALEGTKAALGRRWVRRTLVVTGGTVALVLLARPAAIGGDLLSNVGPASQLQDGALMDTHPLGHYVLDHHFAAAKASVFSGVDVSGIPPTIAWFLANTLWQLTAFIAHAVITLFTFAFSLDLVNGSGATGGASALEPVSRAVRSIYQRTFGEPWLIVAVLLAGLWAIYNALVRRRYVETAGSLAVSVVYVVIALAFVTQPERTIGTASQWSNAMSGAFLSLTTNGSVSDQGRAKQSAADQLFALLVYEPWAVLQFGGREHCVRASGGDKPQSVPVRPLSTDPTRDGTLSRQLQRTDGVQADGKVCISNRNKHAPRFLRFSSGSDERDKLYEAVKDGDKGKLAGDDPAKQDAAYGLGPADRPAAASMGKDGQYERLLMAIVIFAGELGLFLLLGALSVSVILAQVLVLLLLAFAPVSLVVGVFPGRGHAFFLGWLSKLATFLLRKAIYSLLLAVLLAVGTAISEATSSLGWLMAFGLQAAFYWSVFLFRHQLAAPLALATTGATGGTDNHAVRLASLYAVARMARQSLPRHIRRPARVPTDDRPRPDDEPDDDDESDDKRPDDSRRDRRVSQPPQSPSAAPPVEPPSAVPPTEPRHAHPPEDQTRTASASTAAPSVPPAEGAAPGVPTDRDGAVRRGARAADAAPPVRHAAAPERRDPSERTEGPARARRSTAAGSSSRTSSQDIDASSDRHAISRPGPPEASAALPYPERGASTTANPLASAMEGDAERLNRRTGSDPSQGDRSADLSNRESER